MPKKPNDAVLSSSSDNTNAAPQGGKKKAAKARAAAAASGGSPRMTISKEVGTRVGTSSNASNGVDAASGYGQTEREEIARLAHSYWEARGCVGGSAEEDWFRAEREFAERRKS